MPNDEQSQQEDRQLVERFKQGDAQAYDRLVKKYSNRAYSIAYGLLGNREDAEEVAQDTFIRIYRALPQFRGDAEFTTWLYRIATNLAKNKYRWYKSRGSKITDSLNEPIAGDGDDALFRDAPDDRMAPDESAQFKELEKQTHEELQKLPELYREVLIMRNINDMSYEDIAAVLSCKLGTVKSRIARAREELRSKLGL